ncbi:hypothetical protein B0H10DRAFT_712305 [Mycena sp. CBHHK59/15]|nr:hypothetical protein B0H10DRAFT_472786 [Mycena sp. CBHHK59/15]KAJ6631200.1 hypothetical protein B0H10DRAFT_712305 [Mycena sp. CBHHK59/15]
MAYKVRTIGLAIFIPVAMLAAILTGIMLSLDRSRLENGGDHREQLSFAVRFDEPVVMRITSSVRYQFNTGEGDQEYEKLLPSRGHVVHISEDVTGMVKPYTVTLFHQLKCLDIIRTEYNTILPGDAPRSMTRHCMNYLRQTILCRPNMRLESVKNTVGTATRDYEAVCNDWTRVYEEAERNHDSAVSLG